MSIQSHYRKLLASPDDVSLALQLWTELLRSCVASEFATIDVSDSSIKTWKAINKLLYFSAPAVREPILAALKPLLRLWPIGSRPLLAGHFTTNYLKCEASFDSGAWQLVDDLVGGNHQAYAELFRSGHSDLRKYGYEFGHAETDTSALSDSVTYDFPRLESVTATTLSRIFELLCRKSNDGLALRSQLKSLDLSVIDETSGQSIAQIIRCDSLRSNLVSLCLTDFDHVDMLFNLKWPNLKSLQLDLSDDFNCHLLPTVETAVQNLPCLKEIKIRFRKGHLSTDVESMIDVGNKLIRLISLSQELGELSLDIGSLHSHNSDEVRSVFMHKVGPFVTDWSYILVTGLEFPDSVIKPKSVSLGKNISRISSARLASKLSRFFRLFRMIEQLSIEHDEAAIRLLSHPDIMTLKNLSTLSVQFRNLKPVTADFIFRQLEVLQIKTLCLTLRQEREAEEIANYVRFPKSLTTLSLKIDADFEQCKSICLKARNVHKIHIVRELAPDQLFEILKLPSCRTLKSLTGNQDPTTQSTVYPEFDNLENWKELTLDHLELIGGEWFSEETCSELIDFFPSLRYTYPLFNYDDDMFD